jgi:iron complex outermembrane recepter protein
MSRSAVSPLLLGAALIALTAAPAMAQVDGTLPESGATDTTADAEDEGADIVVTARRRAENLQDVPIAVTALSGEALEATGALDITEISETVPNVTLEVSRGTNSTVTAFIRGVGQQDPVAGFEAGVGIYIDDVYLNRPQAAVLDIFDVERVEVLRGPQGTLYGRNTIGGAVKYVTRRLSDDPTLAVRGAYGSYNQADVIVTASTPITDAIRVGASGARLTRDGFGENLTNGLDNYNKDVWAARASAEIDLGDTIQLRFSGDYLKDESNPRNGHRLIPGLVSGAPVLDDVFDTRAGLNTPRQDVESYGVSGTLEWELSDAFTLKSITAYRRDETSTPIDFDSLPAADVDVPAIYENKQFSEEAQLLYSSERLNGLVGFYYLDANAFNIFDVILGTTGALIGVPGLTASTFGDVDTKTYSFFGDFTYDLTDRFSVSLGGRYTNDKRSSVIIRRNLAGGASPALGGAGVPIATTSNFSGSETFEEFTPRASVSFKPSEDQTLYASYSKGFKGGGFDPRGLTTAAPDLDRDGVREPNEIFEFLSFEPETVDSYELGIKGQTEDRSFSYALAAFRADYKDVQIPGSFGFDSNGDGIPDTFIGITSNAGKARISGLEFEGLARFGDDFAGAGSGFRFGVTFGYLNADYKRFIGTTGTDVSDQRVFQNTPKYTASATLTASLPAGPGMLDIVPALSFRSDTSQFETRSPLDQDAYALADLSFVWTSDDDRYSIGLHGKNLFDKEYKVAGYNFLSTNPATGQLNRNAAGNPIPTLGREGVLTAFYGNPRQIFLTAGVKF